jgi:hypothetical protein
MAGFKWTEKATAAALALAEGKTRAVAAQESAIGDRTLYRWLQDPEFSAEVDRLTMMTGIASRAERLRITKRVIAKLTDRDIGLTEKDLLDWLKFAQSETDGIKLDLAKLATALATDETPVADRGSS